MFWPLVSCVLTRDLKNVNLLPSIRSRSAIDCNPCARPHVPLSKTSAEDVIERKSDFKKKTREINKQTNPSNDPCAVSSTSPRGYVFYPVAVKYDLQPNQDSRTHVVAPRVTAADRSSVARARIESTGA